MLHDTDDINALIEGANRHKDTPVHVAPEWEFDGEERAFTVTVRGFERHVKAHGYTYVMNATSMREAWWTALGHHILTQQDIDSYVEPDPRKTFEGAPPADCMYFFNDLRPGAKEDSGVPLNER